MSCNIHWISRFNTLELSCPDSSPSQLPVKTQVGLTLTRYSSTTIDGVEKKGGVISKGKLVQPLQTIEIIEKRRTQIITRTRPIDRSG